MRLAPRDSEFGGQVSRWQVAEVIAAAVANPSLAENKVGAAARPFLLWPASQALAQALPFALLVEPLLLPCKMLLLFPKLLATWCYIWCGSYNTAACCKACYLGRAGAGGGGGDGGAAAAV